MKRAALLALVGALAIGCAPPQASHDQPQGAGEKTGELQVWLFAEPNDEPKEKVVAEAKKEFEAAHDGVTVKVEYLPVDGRANRFNGAFNDSNSSPDVAEFGNTDLAGYVASNGFADLTDELAKWPEAKDLVPSVLDTAKVDGKVYGIPWFTGTRALFYRTDVFDELDLEPPTTLPEVAEVARAIRKAKPTMYGIATGGKSLYSALPYVWAYGGDIAEQKDGKWTATLTAPEAKEGLERYAELISDDICPPSACAQMTGSDAVAAFAAGKAGMVIGGDFNLPAIDAGAVKGKYKVVPLPGTETGSIAPPFAGGNLIGVFRASKKYGLAVEFAKLLAGKKYQQKMYDAMGTLPTFGDVQSKLVASDKSLEPFVASVKAGTKFVPATPAWTKIDAQGILPTAIQQIATGEQSVDEATKAAAAEMNKAFGG
ncbi:extracellular solute-binding protein [Thermocrispum municipale]|jgi:N,N'-diacetylchitobiose transport system substrate-binding protein|uniref:extracellular solute-binding protein n=1 Tax=Thermocrispum municipale TaxID=37926 RepID=UPI00042767CF|nr:extracellular solute-binding protein [Thermocrispum municipale]